VAGVTINVTQSAPPFSLSAGSASFPAAASTGTVAVTASVSTASWTAVSNAGWVAITSGASGKGNQSVGYSVAANTATAARTGTMTVAGLTFTVNQAAAPCSYSVTPPSATVAATAGSYTLQVTTTSGCAWTAASNSSFLNVSAGATGSGSGPVTYAATANTSSARSGALTVAGVTINVTQSAPAAGTSVFSLSPAAASLPAAAVLGTVAVTAPVSTSTWTAVSNASWITVTSGASGKGNQNVGFSVAANTGASLRTGTITIAGLTFTIYQASVGCSGSLGAAVATPNSGGLSLAFPVTIGAGCAWTATSNQPWLTFTSGASGRGNGTAVCEAAVNTTGARPTAVLVIAGMTVEFTE
jgi:hypothetical protein